MFAALILLHIKTHHHIHQPFPSLPLTTPPLLFPALAPNMHHHTSPPGRLSRSTTTKTHNWCTSHPHQCPTCHLHLNWTQHIQLPHLWTIYSLVASQQLVAPNCIHASQAQLLGCCLLLDYSIMSLAFCPCLHVLVIFISSTAQTILGFSCAVGFLIFFVPLCITIIKSWYPCIKSPLHVVSIVAHTHILLKYLLLSYGQIGTLRNHQSHYKC